MRCQEARRLIDLYIDSELDPKSSLEVAEHLEKCAACAERFSRELQLEESLQATLAKGGADPDAALWARLEERIRRDARPPAHRAPRRRLGAIAALLVLAIAAAVLTFAASRQAPPLGALGKAACHSHDAYVAAAEAPEIATASPAEVEAFFRSNLALPVRPPGAPDFAVVGARRCAFGKTHVAFVMGRRGEEPVSAFVFPARDLDAFPEARAALEEGGGRARAAIHGHAVAIATDGERVALVLASPVAGPLEGLAESFLARK